MDAPAGRVAVRSAYNVAGLSFNPRELAAEINAQLPGFAVSYVPDSRQAIADTWPRSLDDSRASADWGWKASIGLQALVSDMLANIDVNISKAA